MSIIIDTLNLLQGKQTANDVAVMNLPSTDATDMAPDMPVACEPETPSVSQPQAPLTTGKSSPPSSITIHQQSWLDILRTDYLQRYLRDGGGSVKFVVLSDSESQHTFSQELGQAASQEHCVFVRIDARYTKIHMVDRLFHKIAKHIDWDELAYRYVVNLLTNHGYQVPTDRKDFTLQHLAALNERKELLFQRDIQTWLEETIERDTHLCREFRMAILRLCVAQLASGESDRVLANAVKEWLCGELRLISGVKKALIFQKVGRHNARYLLSSLTHWLRLAGTGGLVLSLDISRYLAAKRPSPPDQTFHYSSTAVLDLYDMLRQFIDTTFDLEGFMMVVLAPPEFLTDTKRGIDRYEALKQRLSDDRPDPRQPNPFLPLVRLSSDSQTFPIISTMTPRPTAPEKDAVMARQVIEGLRAGIPNRPVVETVGCPQLEIEWRFRRMLEETPHHIATGHCSKGLIVEGSFGSGKSHVLEYLQKVALDANFICSRIVISKETPLYHPARLFQAAIESAVMPDKKGEVLMEIAGHIDPWSPKYKQFSAWIQNPENAMDSRFAATHSLYERMGTDQELGYRMARFWTGDPLGMGELKRYLKECGLAERYAFAKVSMAELAAQRFRFASRLINAAGYAGWILLIDEVEVIGRYSVNQRAKSYAELARLIGGQDGISYPGIGVVLALTDDFHGEILEGKGDRVKIPARLNQESSEAGKVLAEQATIGMQLLESRKIPVAEPTETLIQQTYQTVHSLHLKGHHWHDWNDSTAKSTLEYVQERRMREYVKTWITELDLKRLAPNEAAGIETANSSS